MAALSESEQSVGTFGSPGETRLVMDISHAHVQSIYRDI